MSLSFSDCGEELTQPLIDNFEPQSICGLEDMNQSAISRGKRSSVRSSPHLDLPPFPLLLLQSRCSIRGRSARSVFGGPRNVAVTKVEGIPKVARLVIGSIYNCLK